jgi:hypothetical protein
MATAPFLSDDARPVARQFRENYVPVCADLPLCLPPQQVSEKVSDHSSGSRIAHSSGVSGVSGIACTADAGAGLGAGAFSRSRAAAAAAAASDSSSAIRGAATTPTVLAITAPTTALAVTTKYHLDFACTAIVHDAFRVDIKGHGDLNQGKNANGKAGCQQNCINFSHCNDSPTSLDFDSSHSRDRVCLQPVSQFISGFPVHKPRCLVPQHPIG